MRSSTIDERFERFIEAPDRHRYLLVREQILEHPSYHPYSDDLRLLESAFEQKDYAQVLKIGAEIESVWQLSPRFHYLVGVAALESGHYLKAEEARKLSHACIAGLMETGDGSSRSPFLVTYLIDEYDIVAHQDVEIRQQQFIECDGRRVDVLRDIEGREHWFDVTDLMAVSHSQPRPKAQVEKPHPMSRPL